MVARAAIENHVRPTGQQLRAEVESQLAGRLPLPLVRGLLDAFDAMRTAYYEDRLRPSQLEAGHFAEWAFRICESECLGKFTPVGKSLRQVDGLVGRLSSSATGPDSFRLHIPRVLYSVYNVRNRRGVGHPSGDVNPNRADAELTMTNAAWVVAEMVRHVYGTDIETCQGIVDALVSRRIPIVEDIDGYPKLLRPSLPTSDRILVLLSHHSGPMPRSSLAKALPTVSGSHLTQTLRDLDRGRIRARDGPRMGVDAIGHQAG